MAATVHVLHPTSSRLAGFLRLGHTGHRKLADLHAAGRFPYNRVVVDASRFVEQRDLLRALKGSGCEVILDPNFAEMATIGRFKSSSLQKLPWSNTDRPWEPGDFSAPRNNDAAKLIAAFAVDAGVNAVLAPTHLIEPKSDWRPIDLKLCEALRYELDRAGGHDIAIDYQLITTSAVMKDSVVRASIATEISKLPIENVWLRISGFGATATGSGTRTFIETVRPLHETGRPLVADMVGGFAGLATLAVGAVAGISHGVGQKEAFKARDWMTESKSGGGSPHRAYIPELDRYLEEKQLNAVFGVRGARSRFCCNDTKCCPAGGDDMIENSHAHFIFQRHKQIEDLSRVPEVRRSEHFLLHHLDPAIRTARFAGKLKIEDEKISEMLKKAKIRLIRFRDVLSDMNSKESAQSRSRLVPFRGGSSGVSAVFGR